MRTMRNTGYKVTVLCLLAAFLFASCEFGTIQEPVGSLQVTMQNLLNDRTITPDVSMHVASYRISGSRSGSDDVISPIDITTGSHTFSGIRVGDWTITVEAFNDDDPSQKIGEGMAMVTISGGTTANASITIVPLGGKGDFTFSIDWSGNTIATPQIAAFLTPESESTQIAVDASDIVISGTTATITVEDIDAGYYDFSYILKDGDALFAGNFHEVRILSGHTSSASEVIPVSPFEIALTIQENLHNPFAVTISSADFILECPCTQTFTAAPADAALYQWYLDGMMIAGANGGTYNLDGEGLHFGWHTLAVKVILSDARVSSESVSFYVDETAGRGGWIDLTFTNMSDPSDTCFLGMNNGPGEGSNFAQFGTFPEYSIPVHLELPLEQGHDNFVPGSFMVASSVPLDINEHMDTFPKDGSVSDEHMFAAMGAWEVDSGNVVLEQPYQWCMFTATKVDGNGERRTFDAISNFYNEVLVDNPDGQEDVLRWGNLGELVGEGVNITFTKYGDSFGTYVKGNVSGSVVSVIANDPADPDDDTLGVYTVSGEFITSRGTATLSPPVAP
ncbi:MAG: hypothetical protein AB7D92_04755 [Sphaerochaeta sp.]